MSTFKTPKEKSALDTPPKLTKKNSINYDIINKENNILKLELVNTKVCDTKICDTKVCSTKVCKNTPEVKK
jgi:hypothetical protein